MAKKKFNVSSTLGKGKITPAEPELSKKIPLRKSTKDVEAVKEKVEELHLAETPFAKESTPVMNTINPKEIAPKPNSRTRSKKKEVVEASKPEKLVRLTIDTPAEMHTRLKVKAVLSGISMRDYILKLLERELKKD